MKKAHDQPIAKISLAEDGSANIYSMLNRDGLEPTIEVLGDLVNYMKEAEINYFDDEPFFSIGQKEGHLDIFLKPLPIVTGKQIS